MKKASSIALYFFSAFTFVLQPTLFAQTGNTTNKQFKKLKYQFEKTFGSADGESEIFSKTGTNIPLPLIKTRLPQWALHLPAASDSVIYVIGVSDPDMQKDSAIRLATLRAKALCALLTHSYIRGMSDYYVNDKNIKTGEVTASVYQEYSNIIGKITFNNKDFVVLKDTVTYYKEAIVLAALRLGRVLSSDTTMVEVLGEISGSFTVRNNKRSVISRVEFSSMEKNKINQNHHPFHFIAKKYNNQLKIISDYSGFKLSDNSVPVFYQGSEKDAHQGKKVRISNTLYYGLWYALCSSLLKTLVFENQGTQAHVAGMSDHYTRLTQNINRILSEKTVSMRLTGLHIYNNTLQLKYYFLNTKQ